ncbi:MAG: 4,5-DOPA dioxygenase extradiol [Acidobacteriota bacterium]|nr:4,5-DOPA dioxygenase extradiol [Acidobacteriota bacterium]
MMIKDLKNLPRTGTRMPVLFIGHGNPMNGIEENDFTRGWQKAIAGVTPKPRAVIVVSAHWETRGTHITAMPKPRVIYDFGGFPQALFEARYPASGSPEIAAEVAENLKQRLIGLDETWGLDHGTWTILRHLYPQADVPVLQLSLDYTKPARLHYELAKELAFLRERGVLIIGSGNMVHNLRRINFRAPNQGSGWAYEANEIFKKLISGGEHDKLIEYENLGSEVALAVPTPEHFLPLLYALALATPGEPVEIFNDAVDFGSISMTSVKVG